ncbi:hypothetical protein [Roseomonas sp. CECT 9278]|uniref:hypothetical protein n=1 Tax=Roseomonas sp. CECT 9278 TaxID=2845823 RepID=UPI001E34D91D|nr:hypothetical protein [Roseomonas sp. CECT 9278]CAH0261602.1 hypothetical protein ROS9278_03412 [Roseomonas sp. CECT 9278]
MEPLIEILRLGPKSNLFQVSDGERYGLVEFADDDPGDRERRLKHPHVLNYLASWLGEQGVYAGSQNPKRLEWVRVEMAVVAARS